MKQIFTLLITILMFQASTTHAQVVLNEIYTDPNNGKNEFFEFYNTSTSSVPISLDGYTILSYFEEGSKKGFYILDIPNLFVGPKGFFIGSSSIPYSYQGTSNSTAADFSWNDPALALNYGYIQKWVAGGLSILDGNSNYDLELLPSNFNDFFSKKSGGGATYNAFVYKNGVLLNAFFGGSGGTASMPAFITGMPTINVASITTSDSNNFEINFNSYNTKPAEFVNQDGGTDNGFIRSKDGLCNSWKKSSADITHTPGTSNGKSTGTSGTLGIDYTLFRNITVDSSSVLYNIVSGPANAFPVELQVYKDNGSVPGELDGNDSFIESKVENTITDGSFTTKFSPAQTNIILVAKVAAGCLDQVLFITDGGSKIPVILPIKILSFHGSLLERKPILEWSIAENESGDQFEVQRSTDGRNFTTVGIVFTSEKQGQENYKFKDSEQQNIIYYRLKAINKDKSIAYSRIIVIQNNQEVKNRVVLLQNPVKENLTFSFNSATTSPVEINIYSIHGVKISSAKLNANKGSNTVSVNLNSRVVAGTYILEIKNSTDKSVAKFLKQ